MTDAALGAAIVARFPELAEVPVLRQDGGIDCVALAVGGLICKFPRHDRAAANLRRKARLLHPVRQAALEEAAALGPDPARQVFRQFDGHGWNMAFDPQHSRLSGVHDFGDAGIGDRYRIAVLTGWHRLWEWAVVEPAARAAMQANFAAWRRARVEFETGQGASSAEAAA